MRGLELQLEIKKISGLFLSLNHSSFSLKRCDIFRVAKNVKEIKFEGICGELE